MAQDEGTGGVNMAQMLQALLAEQEQRDEERREERRRHDEEMARREHEMRQQMELLRGLVEGVRSYIQWHKISIFVLLYNGKILCQTCLAV